MQIWEIDYRDLWGRGDIDGDDWWESLLLDKDITRRTEVCIYITSEINIFESLKFDSCQ